MVMKVFNKGQVVLPAAVRKTLGIAIGDFVDVTIDPDNRFVRLAPRRESKSADLAGSLSRYACGKKLPTRKQMHDALRKGLAQ